MTEIVLLADRPGLVPALAEVLVRAWPEWYGAGGAADALAEARLRSGRDGPPLALLALDGEAVVGTVALGARSIASHAHLTPWLVGLWVDPAWRRRGLGGRLVAAARAEAARLGLPRLHAATASAEGLFLRDGWRRIDTVRLDDHPGEDIAVLSCEPAG